MRALHFLGVMEFRAIGVVTIDFVQLRRTGFNGRLNWIDDQMVAGAAGRRNLGSEKDRRGISKPVMSTKGTRCQPTAEHDVVSVLMDP